MPGKTLTRLFQPIQIGTLQLKNRLVMPPMTTNFANDDGTVSDRLIAYYAERARGGVGLVIVEMACVALGGRAFPRQLYAYSNDFIPGWRRLVDAVHRGGARIALQLAHGGRQTEAPVAGSQPVAPSPIPRGRAEPPRELGAEEVEALIEAFAQAARRAREAGFDAVEFHGAHGYLIHQFLSPLSNQRTDRYGGDVEARMTFPLEVVARARAILGKEFPILFRMDGDEFVPGGLTLDQTRIIARGMEQAGVDCLHVSAGCYDAMHMIIQPASLPRGCLVHLAEGIKSEVKVPVITVGRINDPELAEKILEQGKADLISMGRGVICDPEMPNKAKEGRLGEVRKCIACLHCGDTLGQGPMACAINARAGKEEELVITAAAQPKKVIVVGSGPAGMEAARVAALSGHMVSLYEEKSELGGQLLLATLPPYKEEVANLTAFLTSELARLGVEVRLGERLTPDLVLGLNPDAVIIATGSSPSLDVLGADRPNVATAREVVAGSEGVGERVVILGGGRVGLETAELLAGQGRQVTVVEMLPRVAADMGANPRRYLLDRLRRAGVSTETNTRAEEITPEGVVVTSEGGRRTIEANTVVLALGVIPDRELADQLEGKVPQLRVIGDSAAGGNIVEAIHQGFRVGCEV